MEENMPKWAKFIIDEINKKDNFEIKKKSICNDCKYIKFYETYKELDEYVEREAEKRIAEMIKEGKLKPKNDKLSEKEKSEKIINLLTEYGKKLSIEEESR